MEEDLAIPVWRGRKTEREKFAGAVVSWSCEGLMRDGKALQMGTSHELGHNFAWAFDIAYTDQRSDLQRPWQTSWGASTRLLGATIMVHGDDHGLRLAPRVAPIQVVVLVARAGEGVVEYGTRLVEELARAGIRAELDAHVDVSVGRRIIDWELRGVPVRVELGPRDIASGKVPVALRARGAKTPHALDGLADAMAAILAAEQAELLRQATALRDRLIGPVRTLEEAAEQARVGAARLPWAALGPEGERRLLEDGISVRCIVGEDAIPSTTPTATASTRSSRAPTEPHPSARHARRAPRQRPRAGMTAGRRATHWRKSGARHGRYPGSGSAAALASASAAVTIPLPARTTSVRRPIRDQWHDRPALRLRHAWSSRGAAAAGRDASRPSRTSSRSRFYCSC